MWQANTTKEEGVGWNMEQKNNTEEMADRLCMEDFEKGRSG